MLAGYAEGGKLSVHAYRDGGDYVITVKDTGMGIIQKKRKASCSRRCSPLKLRVKAFGLAVAKTDGLKR